MSELYKQGLNRNQQLLFPPSIDDYVDEENSVRAISVERTAKIGTKESKLRVTF